MNATNENDYICGTCKDFGLCDLEEDDVCSEWTDPDEPDPLTDDEKREIVGDRIAHERMETEGYIE